MNIKDGRRCSPKAQYIRRKKIIKLRIDGKTNGEISKIVGCNLNYISTIWQKYIKEGQSSIELKPRGHKKKRLSTDQEAEFIHIMIEKTPDQLGFDFNLWTRDLIRQAIMHEFKLDIAIRTITDYLVRWGFTPQKPDKKIKKKDNEPYWRWLKKVYPEVVIRSKKEKFEINWVYDNKVKCKSHNDGAYPIISENKVYMISSVSNRGEGRFMLNKGKITSKEYIVFLGKLKKDVKKAYLVINNIDICESELVYKWLMQINTKRRLTIWDHPGFGV